MNFYYNRAGEPITRDEAVELLGDGDARRVALTKVGPYVVSTVFLVIDHGLGLGLGKAPVLFETMVFARDDWEGASPGLPDIDVMRYCTEDEARRGHEEMVTLVRATTAEVEQG